MKRSRRDRGRRRWAQPWSEAEARAFLLAWRESGKRLPAYCRERGIGYERVRRWEAKLRGSARVAPRADAVALRAVRIVPDAAAGSEAGATMEIELACGRRVRVEPGFDADALLRLVGALEGA